MEKGLTGKSLADLLGWSQATISRIENGRVKPPPDGIADLARVLELETEKCRNLLLLAEDAPISNRLVEYPIAQDRSHSIEQRSERIRVFHHGGIPGILQTRNHAFEVFAGIAELSNGGGGDHHKAVDARIRRQKLLVDHPEKFEFVLTEAGLRSPASGPPTMRDQLGYLEWFIRGRDLRIGIIPLNRQLPVKVLCDYYIFDRSMVVVEDYTYERVLESPHDVSVYEASFEKMAAEAAKGPEVLRILRGVAEDIEGIGELASAGRPG